MPPKPSISIYFDDDRTVEYFKHLAKLRGQSMSSMIIQFTLERIDQLHRQGKLVPEEAEHADAGG